jgi:hypothetical protein
MGRPAGAFDPVAAALYGTAKSRQQTHHQVIPQRPEDHVTVIPIRALACPHCGYAGCKRTAVDPGGTFVWVGCENSCPVWKVSG